jgi:phage shock protein C
MNDRLYRSVDDRVLAGVCGGLAVRMGVDPSLVRIGYAIVALVTGIFPLLILYVIMAAIVPEEPTGFAGTGRPAARPGPDAVPGWTPPGDAAAWPATSWPAAAETAPATPPGDAAAWPAAGLPGDAAPDGTDVDVTTSAGLLAPVQAPPQPGAEPAPWVTTPTDSAGARRERRAGDPLPGVIGGLVLVGLGTYFLLRDQLSIDWSIVWPVALVALGIVVVLAAFRPRR